MPPEETPPVADAPKKTRRTRGDIEKDWYSCFSRWDKADRTAALKVLGILHDTLPDCPRKPESDTPPAT